MPKSDTSDVMVQIRGDHKDLDDAVRKSRSTLENFGQVSSGIAMKLAGIGIAATAAGVAVGAMAVHQAFAFDGLEKSFNRLVEQQGEDADDFMASLKEMSANTLTEMEIMKRANMGLMLGLDTETLQTFMKTASTIAQATGADVLDMFDSLTSGTARQSRELLDNLGIMISVESANESYAKSIGKTVSELTKEESMIAFTNAALIASEDKLKSLGGYVIDTKSKWEQLGVVLKESSVDLGQRLMPELDKVLDWALSNKTWMAETFTEIFSIDISNLGDNIVDSLESIKTWVSNNEISLGKVWDTFITSTDMAVTSVKTLLGSLAVLYTTQRFIASAGGEEELENLQKASANLAKLYGETGQKAWAQDIVSTILPSDRQIGAQAVGETISGIPMAPGAKFGTKAGLSAARILQLKLDPEMTKAFLSGLSVSITTNSVISGT